MITEYNIYYIVYYCKLFYLLIQNFVLLPETEILILYKIKGKKEKELNNFHIILEKLLILDQWKSFLIIFNFLLHEYNIRNGRSWSLFKKIQE